MTWRDTASRVYGALRGAAAWLWANKPYAVALLSGAVVFMQAAGYAIPPWLYGMCAVAGCAALHSSVKAR